MIVTIQGAQTPTEGINPIALCRCLNEYLDDDSILIGDGGDFVATCAYTLQPRKPLSWLDPGAFGMHCVTTII